MLKFYRDDETSALSGSRGILAEVDRPVLSATYLHWSSRLPTETKRLHPFVRSVRVVIAETVLNMLRLPNSRTLESLALFRRCRPNLLAEMNCNPVRRERVLVEAFDGLIQHFGDRRSSDLLPAAL